MQASDIDITISKIVQTNEIQLLTTTNYTEKKQMIKDNLKKKLYTT